MFSFGGIGCDSKFEDHLLGIGIDFLGRSFYPVGKSVENDLGLTLNRLIVSHLTEEGGVFTWNGRGHFHAQRH